MEDFEPIELIEAITGNLPLERRQQLFHAWMNRVHTRLLAAEKYMDNPRESFNDLSCKVSALQKEVATLREIINGRL